MRYNKKPDALPVVPKSVGINRFPLVYQVRRTLENFRNGNPFTGEREIRKALRDVSDALSDARTSTRSFLALTSLAGDLETTIEQLKV